METTTAVGGKFDPLEIVDRHYKQIQADHFSPIDSSTEHLGDSAGTST